MNSLFISLLFGLFINSNDSSCIEKFHFAAINDTAHVGSTFIKFNVSDSSGNIITVLSPNYTTYAYFKIYKDLSLESYQNLMNQIF